MNNNHSYFQKLEEKLKSIIPKNDIDYWLLDKEELTIITKYENRLKFFSNGKVICDDFYFNNQLDIGKCRFLLELLDIKNQIEFKGIAIVNWNPKEKSGYWIIDEIYLNCQIIEYIDNQAVDPIINCTYSFNKQVQLPISR